VFVISDPWDRRKKKGKKHKSAKKGQSTQDKISSLLVRKASHKGKRNANGNHGSGERAPPPPPRDAIERACNMKEELLQRIEELGDKLPPNTLDQLIDELGGPENVAEVGTIVLPASSESTLFIHLASITATTVTLEQVTPFDTSSSNPFAQKA
jgi:hypothetical protein